MESILIWLGNFFQSLVDKVLSFDLSTILVLFSGIFLGFIIFGCIYGVLLLLALKENKIIVSEETMEKDEINLLIQETLNHYKERAKKMSLGAQIKIIGSELYDLMVKIASHYYPKSKYPLMELSVEEIVELNRYITNRIDGIFSKGALKVLRPLKIAQVLKLMSFSKKVNDTKAVKASKKLKIQSVFNTVMMGINFVNPLYWFRKIITKAVFEVSGTAIVKQMITVVADETSNVYSKNMFKESFEQEEARLLINSIEEKYKELEQEEAISSKSEEK